MDKAEYVARALEIQERAEREMEPVITAAVPRPWRWASALGAVGTVIRHALEDLRRLPPPAGDRADIERHYLAPLAAAVARFDEQAAAVRKALRRGRVRKALACLAAAAQAPTDPADDAWCAAYGLAGRRQSAAGAARDRAEAVGVTTADVILSPLTDEEVRTLAGGGATRPLIGLAAALASVTGVLALVAASPVVPILVGVTCIVVFVGGRAATLRRNGRAVVQAVERGPAPAACAAVVYPVRTGHGKAWEMAVAPSADAAVPVAAVLPSAPPPPVRNRASAAVVFGVPERGGSFAVRFPDGTVLGSGEPAHVLRAWPPPRFRSGRP
ncbi:MAG TPA: hypothetical protein VFJ85_16855 [Acidimicrobiales bacterium]|nr:hypothetical protein [Acidimicrobiales bacterium]